MRLWHCSIDGKAIGPFNEAKLHEMADRGELGPDTLVWNGDPENVHRGWVPASETELAEFFRASKPEEPGLPPIPPGMSQPGGSLSAELDFTLATKGQRFLACLFDVLISIAVSLISFFILALLGAGTAGLFSGAMKVSVALILLSCTGCLIPFVALMGFNLYLLKKNCQTIGKKIMNIKISNVNGSRPSLARIIFLRGLAFGLIASIPIIGAIVAIIDILCIFREDRRTLHDMMAGTIVIKA